ncbi:hypothetical protein ABZS77_20440 [Micromonospora sp. NPDC005298]|uniref:hypothetical protein n=1 Tax=Micromonospora sp. NPDC005298 TaxID=3156873 RepID=UPI0033A10E5C
MAAYSLQGEGQVAGRAVTAPVLTPQQAVEHGLLPAMVTAVEQINENGSPPDRR